MVRESAQAVRYDALAYARAPIGVTATGDTVRALAYASVPHLPSHASMPFWPGMIIFAWVFVIPLALLAITTAYVADLVRRNASTSVAAP